MTTDGPEIPTSRPVPGDSTWLSEVEHYQPPAGSVPRVTADAIVVLVADGCQELAAEVAVALADLGRPCVRRLSALPGLGSRPPALAVLVGTPAHLDGTLGHLAQLRAELDERALPVLALGLASGEVEILRLMAAGASEVLPLPPRQGELRAKVRRLLNGTSRPPSRSPGRGVRVAGRYRIHTALGSGAYGSVYEAWDEAERRQVALKVIPAAGPSARERFLREAYTLASLRDRQLAAVHDVFEDEGQLCLVSDLVRGPTLRRLVLDQGALPPAQVVALLRGLTRALSTLERSGLLHRDIKPANVILRDGRVDDPVLVDFGLAKRPYDRALSSAAFVMGTPGYMAPEVVQGSQVPDGRSDLFSLGMLARFALTGDEYQADLFGGDLVRHMLEQRVEVPPSGDPGLDALLLALTEPDPERRVRSARDLRLLLEALSAGGRSA